MFSALPPAFESREYGLFFRDFDALFYLLASFILAFKFGWVVNNTFFCGVTNSEHTFNIYVTRTLINTIFIIMSHVDLSWLTRSFSVCLNTLQNN